MRLWMTDGRLPRMMGYPVHVRNAAAMWEALAVGHGEVLVGTEAVRIVAPSPYHALRALILDPARDRPKTVQHLANAVLPQTGLPRRIVEDASGELDLTEHGFQPQFRMAVMGRRPGTTQVPADRPGTTAAMVGDVEALTVAEKILSAVFPPAAGARERGGRSQPPGVLDIPGWRVWLGYRSCVPAGAAYTYHDGTSVGVYQVATLPEHRGHGVARAVLGAILDAYPDVPVTLTATEQGRPLYEEFGFETLSEAVWWVPGHRGDDSPAPLG
jgi:GNAT superfamily N-acetyltransferase